MRYLVVALIAISLPSVAQETRSTIHGRIAATPTGAPFRRASVTVLNTDTNTPLHFKTNATGYYEANLLVPGSYRLSVEAAGFKKYVQDGWCSRWVPAWTPARNWRSGR